jgi:hypothetical protein
VSLSWPQIESKAAVAQWVRPCEPVVGASCRQYGQVDGITPLKACCGQFSGRHFSVAVPESGFRVNVMLGLARGGESMELHEMAKTLPCKIAMDDWLEEDVSDPHHPGCRFVGPASLQPPASDMLYPVRFAMVEMACM